MAASDRLLWTAAAVLLLAVVSSGLPNSRTTEPELPQSTFDSIFTAISDKATQLVDK